MSAARRTRVALEDFPPGPPTVPSTVSISSALLLTGNMKVVTEPAAVENNELELVPLDA